MIYKFLSEKPSLKILSAGGELLEFSPYYTTSDIKIAEELRKLPFIRELEIDIASVAPDAHSTIKRDEFGRAKVADPLADDDITTKSYVDETAKVLADDIDKANALIKSTDTKLSASLENVRETTKSYVDETAKTLNMNIRNDYDASIGRANAYTKETETKLSAGLNNVREKVADLESMREKVNEIDQKPLPEATETRKGIAQVATMAQTVAGRDDSAFITPLKLKNVIDNLNIVGGSGSSGGNEEPTIVYVYSENDFGYRPSDFFGKSGFYCVIFRQENENVSNDKFADAYPIYNVSPWQYSFFIRCYKIPAADLKSAVKDITELINSGLLEDDADFKRLITKMLAIYERFSNLTVLELYPVLVTNSYMELENGQYNIAQETLYDDDDLEFNEEVETLEDYEKKLDSCLSGQMETYIHLQGWRNINKI